jgi:hypothetical protein
MALLVLMGSHSRAAAAASPTVVNAGPGCSDDTCIWIIGYDFAVDSYVDIRAFDGGSIIDSYRGTDIVHYKTPDGQDVITLRLRDPVEISLFTDGLWISVVNPDVRTWSQPWLVKR